MSRRPTNLTSDLHDYLLSVSVREVNILAELREETAALGGVAGMQISAEQGQFMQLLVRLIGAKRTLEVGVFTGYSSLAVAMALPEDGQIIACDVSEEWASIGRRYWQKAGVGHKIALNLGPATDTLQKLLDQGGADQFDFAFIDADKENYDTYYERCLQLVRVGGLIGIDNVLWGGSVIDDERQDADTKAIRALNKKLHGDERVDISLVPIGDGLTLLRKR
ncbi:class I SAM-dependent methyltransferase [Chloroflexi bacterium TSY]|nr:class I SAM-dependent methyltransferase [Chloroflexi bacterium TSY]